VSQFFSAPRTSHRDAVVQILGYLKKASGKGFLYSDCGHTRVDGFSDVDWARSTATTGFYVFLGGNLV